MVGKAVKILTAAGVYFAIVFGVGFLLGPIRVLWLEPRLGTMLAVLCELPFLVVAMILAARWVATRTGLDADIGALAAMGIIALLLQQVADVAVGSGLRGITLEAQLAYLATSAGAIYGGASLAFAAMPALVNRRRQAQGPLA